jgi:hypothetical protein
MKIIGIIMVIIGVMGMVISMILTVIYGLQEEGSKVSCYDKYGNEIIGVECISSGGDLNKIGEGWMIFFLASFLFFLMGCITTILDDGGRI